MILHDKKLIFIHIPKCGGTSLNTKITPDINFRNWIEQGTVEFKAVGTYTVEFENQHATYDRLAPIFPNYRYVTQMRNPYTRWISLYKHFVKRKYITSGINEWTPKAIAQLKQGKLYHALENLDLLLTVHTTMGRQHYGYMFLPQWTWFRQPQVKVYKMESHQMWYKEFDTTPIQANWAKIPVDPLTNDNIALVKDYYKVDFEIYDRLPE